MIRPSAVVTCSSVDACKPTRHHHHACSRCHSPILCSPLGWTGTKLSCGLQARLASGEDIFGPLIQKYLLKNSHRIRVDTLPDEELAAKQEADEKQRLGDIRRQMDQTQEQGVIAETLELQHRQVRNHLIAACVGCNTISRRD